MVEPVSCVLVTPISPQQPGNGLAHRCRFWQAALGQLGSVATVVVPVSGDPHPGDDAVALPTVGPASAALPAKVRWAPEHLGRAWRAAHAGPVDVVLALRADIAAFALGAAAASDALLVIDLDDDDADLARSLGQHDEAQRYADWAAELASRADLLVSTTGFGGTLAVPNSVALPAELAAPLRDGRGSLLMVGNFGYEPNRRGATWLIDEVLPRLAERRAGAEVPPLVLAGFGSEVFAPHGVGYVDDLAGLHRDAAVALVPLLEGSGSRIKALDAFANGVPVVGTTVGLGGLPVSPGVDCLVADDPIAFADAVCEVLDGPDLAGRLVAAGHELVRRFDQDGVAGEAAAAIRSALGARRPGTLEPAPELIVSEEPDGLVVVDEVSMTAHHLNELAAAVFLLVEARQPRDAVVAAFADVVERPAAEVADQVDAAVSELLGAGLLVARHGPQAG